VLYSYLSFLEIVPASILSLAPLSSYLDWDVPWKFDFKGTTAKNGWPDQNFVVITMLFRVSS